MCDEEIHQGLTQDLRVSRRGFGMAGAAVAGFAATGARAQSKAEAAVVETDVEVKTPDGVADSVLFHPPGKGRWPAVLIWTDIMGLRPVFRDMGRRLAAQGYVVLVPNPFYRSKRAPVVDATFDFSKPDDRAKVMPLAMVLNADTAKSDATAFIAFLDAQPQTNTKARAGVQGYCMGGPLTFRSAAAVPARFGGAATFHGGGLVSAKPDSPHLLIPTMKAQVICCVADNDDKREPASKDTLKSSFEAAKIPARVEVYDGAAHGWCVKGSAVYNEAQAERAWSELTALYKRALV
ncbi:dienelactone hydrolase family protein [soil metagenome]